MNLQPNRFFHLSLVFLVALNLVPHFNDYTVPTLAVGGVCLCWRLLYEFQIVPLPNFFTKVGLVCALTYLVYQNYGQILGLEAGSALLICAVSLKLIDRVTYRDAMILLFLNFMLLLARFFESQSLGISIFAGFDLIITTALLVQLHNGSRVKFDLMSLLKTSGKLILQIAPLMILLFFIFPRFSTGFFGIKSNRTSLNGFSENIEPGSMASIAQKEQMAFRVRFMGKIPPPTERYWRGAVLAINRGMKWDRGKFKKQYVNIHNDNYRKGLKHEILLEPIFNDWMFGLDKPVWVEQKTRYLERQLRTMEGHVFLLNKPYKNKYLYDVYSSPSVVEELTLEGRRIYLQTGRQLDQRVLQLVDKISVGAKSNEQKALRLMQFYQKQFRYTLTPGKLSRGELGEFLFEKKVGFCEHFAVSFAALMRLANVPSRVIVGFQGGRQNDVSDYLMVTSKDAHAWTEIWSEQKSRWLRFDPTVMVSPLRFELGGQVFHSLSPEELLQGENTSDILAQFDGDWLGQANLFVDAVATNWNLFLLNYDRDGQKKFFARLGIGNVNQNMLLTLSLLILLSFYLWVRIVNRNKRVQESPEQKAYLTLRKKLSRQGIEKESDEGPSDFLKRCQNKLPQSKKDLETFRKLYLSSHYGNKESGKKIHEIVRKI